jgi:hypothetical protein
LFRAAECSAPQTDSRRVPDFAAQSGQLPAFESECRCGVRVRPRQRAGEALGTMMATWRVSKREAKFVRSYKIRGGAWLETAHYFVSLAQSLFLAQGLSHPLGISTAPIFQWPCTNRCFQCLVDYPERASKSFRVRMRVYWYEVRRCELLQSPHFYFVCIRKATTKQFRKFYLQLMMRPICSISFHSSSSMYIEMPVPFR